MWSTVQEGVSILGREGEGGGGVVRVLQGNVQLRRNLPRTEWNIV